MHRSIARLRRQILLVGLADSSADVGVSRMNVSTAHLPSQAEPRRESEPQTLAVPPGRDAIEKTKDLYTSGVPDTRRIDRLRALS
jgi:hypothetical protein